MYTQKLILGAFETPEWVTFGLHRRLEAQFTSKNHQIPPYCKTWLPEQEAVLQHPFSGQPLVFGRSGSHVTRIGSSRTAEHRSNIGVAGPVSQLRSGATPLRPSVVRLSNCSL